ncbi:MAG: RodZ domain-containing protein [Acidimicrobiales bacterium]
MSFDDSPGAEIGPVGHGPEVRRALAASSTHSLRARTALTGAAAAIALAVIAVIGLQLTSSGHNRAGSGHNPGASSGGHHRSGQGAVHRHHHHRGDGGSSASTSTSTTTTTQLSKLQPVSSSARDVVFEVPSTSYTVSFVDSGSGDCWVGVQQPGSTSWAWMTTLSPGQSSSYQASGAVVVRLGAPENLALEVDGLPTELPGYVQPYDVTLNPKS